MKQLILFLLIILFSTSICSAVTIAEDDTTRPNNFSLGPKWYAETEGIYQILNNLLVLNNTNSESIIMQEVPLTSSNYNITFTYHDLNESDETGRVDIMFYVQSSTSDLQGNVIELREDDTSALGYYSNMSYIGIDAPMGETLQNNSTFNFILNGDNVSIYRNGGFVTYMHSWGDAFSMGTVGFKGLNSADGKAITNIIISNESAVSGPAFTYTSTNTTSYENELDTFTANFSQNVNISVYSNSVLMNTTNSVTTKTYTNSTALNGSAHNVTFVIENANGSAQYSWEQLKLLNEIYIFVFNKTQTLEWFNITYTAGTQPFNFVWGNRSGSGNTSEIFFENGTSTGAINTTQVGGNTTLIYPNGALWPETTYYIQETSTTTIETFVVPATAFATIVFVVTAGAFRVSSWINRRRSRRRR